ncbi:MAG: phosphate ABC transporter permease [Chloroflexi bacterium]|nr:MAG: phosphate ABC transporter permease [Chloroflexota bacterium]
MEPPRGWAALNLRELWEYRDLLYFLTWRDIKTRYSQTALGPLWIVLQPLFSMVVYSVIFGGIAKLPTGGIPYPVFSFSGILPWDFFSDSINSGLNSLLINRTVISKVYFPRLHLAFSRVISSLLDLAIATVILFGMILYYNLRPNWTLVFIPLYLGIAMTTGLGFGLLMSGLIVKYRDLGQFVSMFTRAWMYATPVVYSIEAIPEQWRTLYQLNPITNVVIGFRYALLGAGTPPDWKMVLLSAVLGISLFLAGLFAFKRGESNIVDGA